ncbi:hypothetical protein OJ996_00215 [Luteolibacter sp. GHJ8]|uniref:Uncharacterized protein n=1 Tax=Luteolibacter rhizosphaerae TaxID=2989719 RepID=A0ABT3FWK4_9BACT|nr:hypothetical protein [Luteolibacter rhizosphaerae]MCW1911976.1 hypothetical protein [Luteolibacter rhizosphaerae]
MSGTIHAKSAGPAYRLQGPTPHLLNLLCQLGEGTLVLKQQGLSLAKTCSFGLCVADGRGGWNLLRDAISGLESDLQQAHHVYLLPDPDDFVPLLATARPGGEIDLSIRLEHQRWDSRLMRSIIEGFRGIPIEAREGRRLHAGAWLDDWHHTSPASTGIPWEILSALDACRCLEVEVCSGLHRATAAFRPAFLDSEGAVLRIADSQRKNVVFADAAAPGFRWMSLAPGHLKIRAEILPLADQIALPAA